MIFLQRDSNVSLKSTQYRYQFEAPSSTSPPAKSVQEIPYRHRKCSIRSSKGRYRWTSHKSWLCSIHQRLIDNGIKTDREAVRLCLKVIDPEGVERRKAHKLKDECMYLRDQTSSGLQTVMINLSLSVSPFTDQLTVSAGKSCGLIYVLLTTILILLVTSM